MARAAVGLTIASTVIGGEGFRSNGHIADVVNSVSTATVAADIAVLVADGATPTQAHVNTLDTDWAALLAGTGAVPTFGDVVLSYDIAKVGTKSVLKRAILELLAQIDRTSDFAS